MAFFFFFFLFSFPYPVSSTLLGDGFARFYCFCCCLFIFAEHFFRLFSLFLVFLCYLDGPCRWGVDVEFRGLSVVVVKYLGGMGFVWSVCACSFWDTQWFRSVCTYGEVGVGDVKSSAERKE